MEYRVVSEKDYEGLAKAFYGKCGLSKDDVSVLFKRC